MTSARTDQALAWILRAAWLGLPFTLGPALAAALDGRAPALRTVASVELWLGWALGVAAVLVIHPVALTVLRVLAAGAVGVAVATLVAGHPAILGLPAAVAAGAAAMSAPVARRWVNGPAYPNERRFPLRVPGPLLFGPLLVVWALILAGVAAGPVLLADRRWAAGAVSLALGLPLAGLLGRAVHTLSRRWLVFVPAGVVLHDPLSLVDPVLLNRSSIVEVRPALAGSEAVDLTQRSLGLVLELTLAKPVGLNLLRPGQRLGRPAEVTAVLISPTRPGEVLDQARRARVGQRATPPPSTSSSR